MILRLYIFRHLSSLTLVILGFLFLTQWLPRALSLGADGAQGGHAAGFALRFAATLGRSLPETLEFVPIAVMIAAVVSMAILGRRAELHIIRGAGQSPLAALRAYMVCALAIGGVAMLILAPLSIQFERWSRNIGSDQSIPQDTLFAGPYTAWLSLNGGTAQARLQNYQVDGDQTFAGTLVYTSLDRSEMGEGAGAAGPETLGFFFLENAAVSGREMRADLISPDGQRMSSQTLRLDRPPKIIGRGDATVVRSLPHLLGWVGAGPDSGLAQRRLRFAIQRELALPFLSAALVLMAGGLSVGVGTRQPLGTLIIGSLSLFVTAYCLVVVSAAFGENGKLNPFLAAWGPTLVLGGAGLSILMGQELSWIFRGGRFRRS